jgi:hypothetical protein
MKPDIVSKACLNDRLASGGSGTTAFLSLLCRNTVRAVFRNNIVNVDSAGGSRHNAILTGKNLVRHGNRTTRGRGIAGLEDTDRVPPSKAMGQPEKF